MAFRSVEWRQKRQWLVHDVAKQAVTAMHSTRWNPERGAWTQRSGQSYLAIGAYRRAREYGRPFVARGELEVEDLQNILLASAFSHDFAEAPAELKAELAADVVRNHARAQREDPRTFYSDRDHAMIAELIKAGVDVRNEPLASERTVRDPAELPVAGGEFPLQQRITADAQLGWIGARNGVSHACQASFPAASADGRHVSFEQAAKIHASLQKERLRIDNHGLYLPEVDERLAPQRELNSLALGQATDRLYRELQNDDTVDYAVARVAMAGRFVNEHGYAPTRSELRDYIGQAPERDGVKQLAVSLMFDAPDPSVLDGDPDEQRDLDFEGGSESPPPPSGGVASLDESIDVPPPDDYGINEIGRRIGIDGLGDLLLGGSGEPPVGGMPSSEELNAGPDGPDEPEPPTAPEPGDGL